MNRLPATSLAVRLNALVAAAIVTLTMLSGIDALAVSQSAAPQVAQSVVSLPA